METPRLCQAPGCETPITGGITKKFCSASCKVRVHRKRGSIGPSEKKCLYCAKTFIGSPLQKFCCLNHKIYHHRNGPIKGVSLKKCLLCEGDFIGGSNKKFCCDAHKFKWHANAKKKNEIPSIKKCKYCQEDFLGLEKKKFCCKEHKAKGDTEARKAKRGVVIKEITCLYCAAPFTPKVASSKRKFCCIDHSNKYHHIKRLKTSTLLGESGSLEGLKSKRICLYCTTEFRSNKSKFCCPEHSLAFKKAKRAKRPIMVRVNNKMTLATRKYDKILEIVEKYRELESDFTRLNSYNVGG